MRLSPGVGSRCLPRKFAHTNHSGSIVWAFAGEEAGIAVWKDGGSICWTPGVEEVVGQRNWAEVEPGSCWSWTTWTNLMRNCFCCCCCCWVLTQISSAVAAVVRVSSTAVRPRVDRPMQTVQKCCCMVVVAVVVEVARCCYSATFQVKLWRMLECCCFQCCCCGCCYCCCYSQPIK